MSNRPYIFGICLIHLLYCVQFSLAAFDRSHFPGLIEIENSHIHHSLIHENRGPDKRSAERLQIPSKIKTHISTREHNIELEFIHQQDRALSSLRFRSHGDQGQGSLGRLESNDVECTHFYEDQDGFGHAIVSTCDASRNTSILIAEIRYEYDVLVILPDESGSHLQQHRLYKVNTTADFHHDFVDLRPYPVVRRTPDFNRRVRRGTVSTAHVLELLFVADYKLYTVWYDMTTGTDAARETEALSNMRKFYSFVANSMHLRYQGLGTSNIDLSIELIDIYVIKTEAEATFISNPNYVLSQDRGAVSADTVLSGFQTWVTNAKGSITDFPDADHYMLLTGHDLMKLTDLGSAGLANLGAVCTSSSMSISEATFNFLTAVIASHELAHSLGGLHDGDGNLCDSNDFFILATTSAIQSGALARNPWTFSSCSATYISDQITQLNTGSNNCLLTNDAADALVATGMPPGQTYSPDRQCELIIGTDSVFSRSSHSGAFDQICTGMNCTISSTQVQLVLPGIGTTCGDGKWCWDGECVTSPDAPAVDVTCLFGDQPGVILSGQTCLQAVASRLGNCYDAAFRETCCATCEANKLSITGCEYGDTFDCSSIISTQCYNTSTSDSKCCKTCTDFEKSNLPASCKYGDQFSNCGQGHCDQYPDECCETCGTTVTTADPDVTTQATESSSLPTWAIVAAAVGGGVFGLFILILLIIFCCGSQSSKSKRYSHGRHSRKRHSQSRQHGRHRDHRSDYRGSVNKAYEGSHGYDYGRHSNGSRSYGGSYGNGYSRY